MPRNLKIVGNTTDTQLASVIAILNQMAQRLEELTPGKIKQTMREVAQSEFAKLTGDTEFEYEEEDDA